MEDYKQVIGQRLKHLRKNNPNVRMTTDDIASKLGVSRSTYTGYELGRRAPNGDKLKRLAEIFNTTVDYITGKDTSSSVDIKQLLINGSITYEGKTISDDQKYQLERIIGAILEQK